MDVNRGLGLGLSGSFSEIPLLDQQPGELRAQSTQNSSEQLQTLGAGVGMAQRPNGTVRASRSSSFSSISSLSSRPHSLGDSRRPLLRQESDASSRRPLLGHNSPLRYSDRSASAESLSSGTQRNQPEPQEQGRSPSLSSDQAHLLVGKSNIHKRRSKKDSGANERQPKPDEDERPRKHKTKSKNGSGKLRQQLEEQIPKYCCIAMGESSDSDSSDEEDESNVNKKAAGLFFLGMLAGVGSTLAFFRYGGAAATAVSGFASISHSVNTDSTVKGSDNKVVGAGGSGFINVNLAKGGANIGVEATDSLAYPGMTEALKSECFRKGMTYIDPTTGEWLGFSSTAGTGKCLLDIPKALIKGKCIKEKYDSEIKALREKLETDYEIQRLNNMHKLMMAEDRRAFELASADARIRDEYARRYINEIQRNSMGWNSGSRGSRGRRGAEDEQIPSTSNAPQATDADTRDLLDSMRGTTANQADRTQGLNWLKKANKRR